MKKPTPPEHALRLLRAVQNGLFGGPPVPTVAPEPPEEPQEVEATPRFPVPKNLRTLFDPNTDRVMEAIRALAPSELLTVHAEHLRRFPQSDVPWAAWAGTLQAALDEGVDALCLLADDAREATPKLFDGMPSGMRRVLQTQLVQHVMARRVAEDGDSARLSDGKPVGALALEAGMLGTAESFLVRAVEADPSDGLASLYLGRLFEETWRPAEAFRCTLLGLWLEPAAESLVPIRHEEVLELIDAADELELEPAAAWAPVLACLGSRLSSAQLVEILPEGPRTAPQRFVAELERLRTLGPQAEERLQVKRRLLAIEPLLKEQIRRL
ncbi:MAG: hypothetical protein CO108_30505 [Deltaproteobacteria bacterium CG_4_9_14_3_um_filter_63_12]|nr:MAG: hypothetical protein CO108_30505 [Deltaproteobacteria bacterium CG_4_9_14_3_um_filter_63_12]